MRNVKCLCLHDMVLYFIHVAIQLPLVCAYVEPSLELMHTVIFILLHTSVYCSVIHLFWSLFCSFVFDYLFMFWWCCTLLKCMNNVSVQCCVLNLTYTLVICFDLLYMHSGSKEIISVFDLQSLAFLHRRLMNACWYINYMKTVSDTRQ